MSAYGGRPHWGKINFLDYEKASSLYGENLQRFITENSGSILMRYFQMVFQIVAPKGT